MPPSGIRVMMDENDFVLENVTKRAENNKKGLNILCGLQMTGKNTK